MLSDLSHALRTLRRTPAFTVAAALCIALAVGANAAVFSVVSGVLLRPLPYPRPSELTVLWERTLDGRSRHNVVSPANFLDWRARTRSYTGMAALVSGSAPLSDVEDPEELQTEHVTPDAFGVLGVRPALGRGFVDADAEESAARVVVLSDALWRRRFGADPAAVGRTITLGGRPTRIVGVMPAGFRSFDADAELWRPMRIDPTFDYRERSGRYITVIARRRADVTLDQARRELDAVAQRLATEHPEFNGRWGVTVRSMTEQLVGDVRGPLVVLASAVGLVLLIACANVANLQLTRAAARRQELAVRGAIGAGRWDLARQVLAESTVVALAGGALGLAGAAACVRALVASVPDLPRVHEVALDWRVVAFTLGVSLLTGVLFGLVPALQAARTDVGGALREGGRGAVGGASRARATLAGVQLALALVLLVGAGLLLRSFDRLTSERPGFAPERVLTGTLSLVGPRYRDDVARAASFDRVVRRARDVPGVREVGAISWLPFAGLGSTTSLRGPEFDALPPADRPSTRVNAIVGDYFRAMGIPLLQGTTFSGAESPTGEKVVIVSEALAKRFYPGGAVGQRLQISWGDSAIARIIGVVGDVRDRGYDSIPHPTSYWPATQLTDFQRMTIVARLAPGAVGAEGALRRAVLEEDPGLPLGQVKMLEVYLAESVARRRLLTMLVTGFGALALVLASVGLYGVIAYGVAQRTRELGVRVALGARTGDVVRLVVGGGLRTTAIGVAVGLAGAIAATRLLAGSLYGVASTDPVVYAGVAALLAVVSAAASWIPARRAARVDPVTALRSE